MRRLIRAEEVANSLGITRLKVYRMAKDGTLPSVKFGKSIRFDPDVLTEWIEKNLSEGKPTEPVRGTRRG
jgi:excisionase family DNA binding protein